MLEIQNLTKTFGTFKALDDLSMTVPKGAVYGLVGPNGAGKSTAIRCLLGVYRPVCPERLKDRRILLLDDIVTTGSTAGECARVLLTAGAKEVHCGFLAAANHHK